MKYLSKKCITLFILILYGILNFVNFTDMFVCISNDHIGLNIFGIDRCCIEHEKFEINYNDKQCMNDLHNHCNDKHLAVNVSELFSDTYSDLVYIVQDEARTILNIICSQYYSILKSKNILQPRAPSSINLLSVLKKVKLTI